MENLNSSKSSEIESLGVKNPKNIKNAILNLLKKSTFGLNISQITEELNLSRNTVKKYIRTFEKEKLIEVRVIGRSKICYPKNKFQDQRVIIFRNLLFEFINGLVGAFEKVFPNFSLSDPKNFIKQIGSEMSKTASLPLLSPPAEKLKKTKSTGNKRDLLKQISQVSLQFLEVLNHLGGKMIQVEIVPNPKTKNTDSVVIRVQNTSNEFRKSEFFYHLSAGFYEYKLRENFGDNVYLEVLEYQTTNNSCYFRLGISENK
ncbi:MAG: HTH domain-containing protein [Candidatus Helarchaeota archaeon]